MLRTPRLSALCQLICTLLFFLPSSTAIAAGQTIPAEIQQTLQPEPAHDHAAGETALIRTHPSPGSATPSFISVPRDPQFLAPRIEQWLRSPDPAVRAFACNVLREIEIPHRADLLTQCLNDPAIALPAGSFSPWTRREYPVRAAAVEALARTDAPPPTVSLIDDRPLYHPIPATLLLVIPPAAFLLLYLAHRRRHRPWPAVLRAALLFSLLPPIAIGAICIRSYAVADELFYAGYSHLLAATSSNGSLQLLHAGDFHSDQALALGSLRPSDGIPFWHRLTNAAALYQPAACIPTPHRSSDFDPYDFPAQVITLPCRYLVPALFVPSILLFCMARRSRKPAASPGATGLRSSQTCAS